MKRIPIYITARDFTQSHGRMPRGRGSWAFEITYLGRNGGEQVVGPVFTPSMTFSESKRWIKQYITENAPDEADSADADALS